jgi:hypothetical protein
MTRAELLRHREAMGRKARTDVPGESRRPDPRRRRTRSPFAQWQPGWLADDKTHPALPGHHSRVIRR